jgi:hypothetical protein
MAGISTITLHILILSFFNAKIAGLYKVHLTSSAVSISMTPERREDKYRINFEDVASKAKEVALHDGKHVPILIVEGSKSLIVSQIQDMPETHGERVELMRFFGQAAAKSGRVGRLEQVFFISEGWMSVANEGKLPENRPSQDPNRKEVLIISGLELKGLKKSLKLFEMVRNENKQVVDLPELSSPQGKEGAIEIPLLDAFAQGFRTAFQMRVN